MKGFLKLPEITSFKKIEKLSSFAVICENVGLLSLRMPVRSRMNMQNSSGPRREHCDS